MGNPAESLETSARSVDDYWSRLTDDELRKVVWFIADPLKLENVQPSIPDDLPDFTIELAYDLDRSDPPVPCAHCPQHQAHWHGFVLKAGDGKRYLLGSHCGPKAYASDYWVASAARNKAKKRAEALRSWDGLQDQLSDYLEALDEAERSASLRAVRRIRGAWENRGPAVLRFLRSAPKDSLTGAISLKFSRMYRDLEAERRREQQFQAEAPALAELPNKQHAKAIAELRQRIGSGEVWRTEEKDFGVLRSTEWLTSENPFKALEDISRRLHSYHILGKTTQDKATARLEQFTRETRKDLDRADVLLRQIASAGAFFSPEHLVRLAGWAADAMDLQVGRLTWTGRELLVTDFHGETVALALAADWSDPGEHFRTLRAN